MRFRFTLVAFAASLLLLGAAAIVLGVVLRLALIEEVDRTLENRAIEVATELVSKPDDDESVEYNSVPNDADTEVFTITTGDPANSEIGFTPDFLLDDDLPEAGEVLAVILGADGLVREQPVTASLPSFNGWLGGAGDLRVVPFALDETEAVVVVRKLDDVTRTLARVRNVALPVVPLASLLIAALVWMLTGRALRPVEAIRREVEEISATDLARRVPETGRTDEIGRLATTMNGMLGRLDRASVRQRRFVSDAAHELRSPLASIAAQLDVDLAHPDQANWSETAQRVRGEASRMEILIEDLLVLARQDGDAPSRPAALVDLDDAIFAEAAGLAGTAVAIDCSQVSGATVRGDAAQLRRLISNLLTNGVRHANAQLRVSANVTGDAVVVSVEDDGAGVRPDDRELIFDRFVRLDEARARDAGGSGLGLAISRELATAHGGTLVVGDSELGGACFTLTLPAV